LPISIRYDFFQQAALDRNDRGCHPLEIVMGESARNDATQLVVNDRFNQAALFFGDGSCLRFEHTSRQNRWARASSPNTTADSVSGALSQFRLNAKHLQLFFDDGSDADFPMTESTIENDGSTLG